MFYFMHMNDPLWNERGEIATDTDGVPKCLFLSSRYRLTARDNYVAGEPGTTIY